MAVTVTEMGRLFVLCLALSWAAHARAAAPAAEPQHLCPLLETIGVGERRPVVVTGRYEQSFENAVLFDPEQPECTLDVEAITDVEFAPEMQTSKGFDALLKRDQRADVTFVGVLEGPGPLGPDDPSIPPSFALMRRVRGQRYGHVNSFRTRLIVQEVLRAVAVPKHAAHFGEVVAAARPSTIPTVRSATLPTYPAMARNSGITGTTTLAVSVSDGVVTKVEPLSGDRMLSAAAKEAIESWRFDPGVTTTFVSTFVYALEQRVVGSDENPRLEMQLPLFVRITGKAGR